MNKISKEINNKNKTDMAIDAKILLEFWEFDKLNFDL